jgi:hypothetical protein
VNDGDERDDRCESHGRLQVLRRPRRLSLTVGSARAGSTMGPP